MNVLITGGTGFIGQQLVKRLTSAGHHCDVLTRQSADRVAELFPEEHSLVSAIHTLVDLPVNKHYRAVINLAGEPIADKRWSDQRKLTLRDSRVALTEQLIAAIQQWDIKPEVMISGSAIGYYGNQGDVPCIESTPPRMEFTHELCRDWERAARQCEAMNVRCCLVRTGLVVGPGGGFLDRLITPFRLGLGAKLGSGKQWMSWIHMADMIEILMYLLETESASGVYNATAPNPVTNKDFTRLLADALNKPALFTIPSLLLNLALGEMAVLLLGGQRVLPEKLKQEGFQFQYPTLRESLQAVFSRD